MHTLRIRIQGLARTPFESIDEEGEHLASLVTRALSGGQAAAVAVVIRAERTELVAMRPVIEGRHHVSSFLAGLSRSVHPGLGPALAIGVAGRFMLRRNADVVAPVALAFLEWSDCQWWQWQTLLDADGVPVEDTEVRRRAADGDALPSGLGRWWSLGRRTRAEVRYGEPIPPETAASPPLVH